MNEARLSAVVLAAGLSARMGGSPKLLLDVGEEPMIRRTVRNVLEFGPAETIVVTGHRASEMEAALAGLPVRLVHNPDYEKGQPTSVAAGVKALRAPCGGVMVVLGDQPLLTAARLRELAAAFERLDGRSILVPTHNGARGNPVVFAAHHIPEVIGGHVNLGCRRLVETQADRVARVEFNSDAFTFDCDTPDDYQRLLGRLKDPSP